MPQIYTGGVLLDGVGAVLRRQEGHVFKISKFGNVCIQAETLINQADYIVGVVGALKCT